MIKPNRHNKKYWRVVGRGEYGDRCRFLEWRFNEDMKNYLRCSEGKGE